jgi:HSP20 family molecular chaperone IbpA
VLTVSLRWQRSWSFSRYARGCEEPCHVVVKDGRLENGLLHVDLVREIPEAMKPRAIPIASSGKVLDVQPTKAAA